MGKDGEVKKCKDCYYYEGTCLCGESKKYGSFLLFKACEHWCRTPKSKEENKESNEEQ